MNRSEGSLSWTQFYVAKRCLLVCLFVVVQCGKDRTVPPDTLSNGKPHEPNAFTDNNSSLSWFKQIDWTRQVIVVSSKTQVKLKMGKSTQLRLVISMSCASEDVEHIFALESSSLTVAYLPANQKTSFTLSCKFSKPFVEAAESFSKLYHQFYADGVFEHRIDSKANVKSPEYSKNMLPKYYNATTSLHDLQDLVNPENVVMLRALPRVTFDTNVTISTDLLGRSWLLVTSNTTISESSQSSWQAAVHRNSIGQDHSKQGNATSPSNAKRSSHSGDVVHEIPIIVLRNMRPIDFIFRIVLFCFVAISSVAMGCKTDLAVVKEVLKRPVAPGLGFVAQYVFMPLIAFTMAKLVELDNPALRLGIFTCGVCPGGGASNIFALLLHGDLSLSVTMTCVSSVLALAMIPLWMFTLGQQFHDDKISINIPFFKIMESLSIVVVPLFIGFFLNVKFPKIAANFQKIIKPLSILTIAFILTVGVYSNLYLFRLFQANTVLAACLLPYLGYLVGACLALLSCQPWERVKTIAIETGIQNTTVAYLMLTFSLPAPDSDLAAVGSAASALMTPLPLLVITIGYVIYRKWKKARGDLGSKFGKEPGENCYNNEDGDDEKCRMTKTSEEL